MESPSRLEGWRRNLKPLAWNREMRRAIERMGMNFTPLEGVKEVIIRTNDREILIKKAAVNYLLFNEIKIYQVMAEEVEERGLQAKQPEERLPEEDVELVAAKAGVAKEVAREALRKTKGDLAEAILLLKGGRQA
ncbi:MAG: hypothetical protein C4339_00690 [Nitrososphaerota archaeon]